jgi:hypothetical protein
MSISSPLSVGLFAGKWCSYAESTDLPSDQREEDGGALLFYSPPLDDDMEMLGSSSVKLTLSSNVPQAMIAVRLSDVDPNGRATRITYGLLNLSHRESDEQPEPLEPGQQYTVTVPMNHVAQRFPKGHRIRLAISTSYWPLAWPSPRPTLLKVHPEDSTITIPWRPPKEENLRSLGTPRSGTPMRRSLLVPAFREWTVTHNLASNEVTQKIVNNDARYLLEDIGLETGNENSENYSYVNNNYDTLRAEVRTHRHLRREGWKMGTFTRTIMTSTPDVFRIRATLDAYSGEARVFSKSWDESVPRDMI